MATVEFRQASRIYDAERPPAVNRINLTINDGEFLVLVGPSGCGKSTTLRMLAGLEPIDEGAVLIDGEDVSELRARDRDVAMVFQSYALYPNMTARQNMAFALENAKLPKAEIAERVNQAAEMLELTDLLDTRPGKMSGGQRQRVAMGRAIVRAPRVFCMDEPLSNLDARLRVSTRSQIASLQRRLGVTTVYVTHDQTEAMTMGDRVAVLNQGVLQQVDTPDNLYANPANTFVATFIGSPAMTLIDDVPLNDGRALLGKLSLDMEIGAELAAKASGNTVIVGVRPESWELLGVNGQGLASPGIPLQVEMVENLGSEAFAHCTPLASANIRVRGDRIIVRLAKNHSVHNGDLIQVRPLPEEVCFFDQESETNLALL